VLLVAADGVADDDGDALRVIDSRGVAEDGVYDAEDGGVGSDAKRQGNDRGEGEAGQADDLAECVTQVLEDLDGTLP